MAKTKFEQYQNAINALTTRQIASGKGWNPGFQIIIDKLTDDREIKFNSDAIEWASPYDVDAYVYNGGERLKARAEDGKVLFMDQYGNKFELKPYKG